MSALLALAMQVTVQPPASRRKVSSVDLNAMADECRAPRQWLRRRGNQIVFRADPDADYDKIECVLKKVSAVVATSNIALIGNEPASEEK